MSRNTSSGRVPADKKEFLKAIARPLAFILCLIMVCAFLAHYLLDSETLSEYAENNPEAAYGDTGDGGQPDDTTAADTASESTDAEAADSAGNNDSRAADSAGAEQTADTGTEEGSTARTALTPDKPAAYNIAEDQSRAAADASSSAAQKEGSETMTENPERTVYRDGFYYEPLSDEIKERITGISYPKEGCTVPYEDLNYVGLLYVDFNGNVQEGELICNAAIAQDLTEIFYELYRNDYRLERVRLVDEGEQAVQKLDGAFPVRKLFDGCKFHLRGDGAEQLLLSLFQYFDLYFFAREIKLLEPCFDGVFNRLSAKNVV